MWRCDAVLGRKIAICGTAEAGSLFLLGASYGAALRLVSFCSFFF
jgi:hypothetical protein